VGCELAAWEYHAVPPVRLAIAVEIKTAEGLGLASGHTGCAQGDRMSSYTGRLDEFYGPGGLSNAC
jgi:hypothetical protein